MSLTIAAVAEGFVFEDLNDHKNLDNFQLQEHEEVDNHYHLSYCFHWVAKA